MRPRDMRRCNVNRQIEWLGSTNGAGVGLMPSRVNGPRTPPAKFVPGAWDFTRCHYTMQTGDTLDGLAETYLECQTSDSSLTAFTNGCGVLIRRMNSTPTSFPNYLPGTILIMPDAACRKAYAMVQEYNARIAARWGNRSARRIHWLGSNGQLGATNPPVPIVLSAWERDDAGSLTGRYVMQPGTVDGLAQTYLNCSPGSWVAGGTTCINAINQANMNTACYPQGADKSGLQVGCVIMMPPAAFTVVNTERNRQADICTAASGTWNNIRSQCIPKTATSGTPIPSDRDEAIASGWFLCATSDYTQPQYKGLCPPGSRCSTAADPRGVGCWCPLGWYEINNVVGGGSTCFYPCDNDKRLNPADDTCVQCPTGQLRDPNDPTKCIPMTPTQLCIASGGTWTTGACVCAAGKKLDAAGSCKPIAVAASSDSGGGLLAAALAVAAGITYWIIGG